MGQPSQIKMSMHDIGQYAYNAGFRGLDLVIAVAVAMAESGGVPSAYNPETASGTPQGSGSRGLWQIYGKAHPEYNNDAVYDPQVNANAAFAIWKQAGHAWQPWSTFKDGKYKQFLVDASKAVQGMSGLPPSNGGSGDLGGAIGGNFPGGSPFPSISSSDVLGSLATLWQWLSDPGRVFKLLFGSGLLLVAIVLLVVGNKDVQHAAKSAAKAATV